MNVWNFTETALRLPSSKCPCLSRYRCRGVAACPPCKTTQEVHVVRLKCRSLRLNLSSETAITMLLKVKVQMEVNRVFFCGGYFKNSGALSDINFKPVS